MTDLMTRVRSAVAGRYTIESEIGRGGMAVVYLAEDSKHDRRVAIKVLHPELAAALGGDRFLREIQIAAKLEHPHILALIDSGDADGLPYYVMPYVDGESLRERIEREGSLPVDESLVIASEVADALDYAHRQGVVHRDIKPGNILLAEGHARIADFGVARAVGAATEGDATATGLAVGTPRYMSPEQAAGTEVDGRSDIYSLGCVLYEMLAGEPPFGGPTPAVILAQKAIGDIPEIRTRRRTLSPATNRILSRAMAPNPDDRYATARAFAAALKRPEREKRGRWRRRGAYRRMLDAGVALILLGGGAWLAIRFARRTGSPSAEPGPAAVAVLDFENLSGDSALENVGRVATFEMLGSLGEIDAIRVVSGGAVDETTLAELRDQTLATIALQGSLYSTGDSLLMEARLIDTRSAEVVEGVEASAGLADPAVAVHALRDAVLVAVATHFNLGERYLSSYGQASSYEAWEHLAFARELLRADGSERQALRELKRAIEVDSTFDAARGLEMIWHVNLGEFDQADSIATELERRIDDLAPRTRWQLAVQRAVIRRDRDGLVKAHRDWKNRLPNARRYSALAGGLMLANRPHECLAVLDSAGSDGGNYADRAFCYHAAGEYRRGLEQARMGREQFPEDANLRIQEAIGLAATGESEAALGVVANALSAPVLQEPREHELRFWLLVDVALEMRAHGDPTAAAKALNRAVAWYGERTLRETSTAADRWRYGRTLYAAGRWEEARSVFEDLSVNELRLEPSLHAHNIDVSRLGYLGVLSARLGDGTAADSIDEQLAAMRRPWLWGHAAYWRAAIAAARGNPIAATDRLAEALNLGLFAAPWGAEYPKWDFHIDPDFEAVRDYPPFRELIEPRG